MNTFITHDRAAPKISKILRAVCIGLTLVSSAASAQAPRLALSVTDPIGTSDGSQCVRAEATAAQASLALTEKDVRAWSPYGARWTLDPARFPASIGDRLADHCFILTIDGKTINSGVVLWVDTPRLTGYPTLNVIPHDGALTLQLTSGNHGTYVRAIHAQAIEDVLGNKANLAQQLESVKGGGNHVAAGRAWADAVRHLMDQKAIKPGIPVADVIAQLGPSTSTSGTGAQKTYTWYFDTPMHVNPIFTLEAKDDIVLSYWLDHR